MSEKARERLRDAQRREVAALAAVEAAEASKERAQAKFAAAMAEPRKAVDAAGFRLACAQAALVQVSGASRAARLLDMTVTGLRAAIRVSRRAEPPSNRDRTTTPGADDPSGADTLSS